MCLCERFLSLFSLSLLCLSLFLSLSRALSRSLSLLPTSLASSLTCSQSHLSPLALFHSHSRSRSPPPFPHEKVQRGRSCLFPAEGRLLAERLRAAPIYISLSLHRQPPLEDVLIASAAVPLDVPPEITTMAALDHGPTLVRLVNLRGEETAVVALRVGLRTLGTAALRHFAGQSKPSSGIQWQPVPAMSREAWLRSRGGQNMPRQQWVTWGILAEEEENAPPALNYTKPGPPHDNRPLVKDPHVRRTAAERAAIDRLLLHRRPADEEGLEAWVRDLPNASGQGKESLAGRYGLLEALHMQLSELLSHSAGAGAGAGVGRYTEEMAQHHAEPLMPAPLMREAAEVSRTPVLPLFPMVA